MALTSNKGKKRPEDHSKTTRGQCWHVIRRRRIPWVLQILERDPTQTCLGQTKSLVIIGKELSREDRKAQRVQFWRK